MPLCEAALFDLHLLLQCGNTYTCISRFILDNVLCLLLGSEANKQQTHLDDPLQYMHKQQQQQQQQNKNKNKTKKPNETRMMMMMIITPPPSQKRGGGGEGGLRNPTPPPPTRNNENGQTKRVREKNDTSSLTLRGKKTKTVDPIHQSDRPVMVLAFRLIVLNICRLTRTKRPLSPPVLGPNDSAF